MKRTFFLIMLGFLGLTAACNGHRQTETTVSTQKDSARVYHITLQTNFENTAILDTFSVWKQFFRLWNMPAELNKEELKDRLTLIQNALVKMQRSPYPKRLDTVDVKSRLRLVMNETDQLKWTVDNNWQYPAIDSLLKRWTGSYDQLVHTINRMAADTVDFERVFREKAKRDSLINRQFSGDQTSQQP